ncbi:MAG: zinc ribbon domain-containing protein [bacterium]
MENNIEKLKAIEVERNDLLNKLKKIEEKKMNVSHEVYVKVKRDYETKLKKLDESIAQNRELVKIEMERLKEEIQDLSQKHKDLKLQLEEIELRYSIGEYSEDKYTELEKEAREDFTDVSEKIKNLEERINWCEGLVGVEEKEEEKLEVKEEESVIEPAVEQKVEELTIDEHILEEKLPEEVKKLDELLVETSNLLESEEKSVEEKGTKEKKKEEGIACPKCGYVNPPDSWYCEKCGAEILTGS